MADWHPQTPVARKCGFHISTIRLCLIAVVCLTTGIVAYGVHGFLAPSAEAQDFAKIQRTIHALEGAYGSGSLSAAIACKDFDLEADWMIRNSVKKHPEKAQELSTKDIHTGVADALSKGFIKEFMACQDDWKNITRTRIVAIRYIDPIFALAVEELEFKDNAKITESLILGRTHAGWAFLVTYDQDRDVAASR